MKFSLAALALTSTAPAVFGFTPATGSQRVSSALSSTVEPPQRIAPDAGYMPEWEDRKGLAPEEFMKSDMSKPDLAGMWECPLTRWDSEGYVGNGCEERQIVKRVLWQYLYSHLPDLGGFEIVWTMSQKTYVV